MNADAHVNADADANISKWYRETTLSYLGKKKKLVKENWAWALILESLTFKYYFVFDLSKIRKCEPGGGEHHGTFRFFYGYASVSLYSGSSVLYAHILHMLHKKMLRVYKKIMLCQQKKYFT